MEIADSFMGKVLAFGIPALAAIIAAIYGVLKKRKERREQDRLQRAMAALKAKAAVEGLLQRQKSDIDSALAMNVRATRQVKDLESQGRELEDEIRNAEDGQSYADSVTSRYRGPAGPE